MLVKTNANTSKRLLSFFRLLLHLSLVGLSVYLLHYLLQEETCMVEWGILVPFMVYPKYSEGYNH